MDRLDQNLSRQFNPIQQFYTATVLMLGLIILLLIDRIGQRVDGVEVGRGQSIVRAVTFPSVRSTARVIDEATSNQW